MYHPYLTDQYKPGERRRCIHYKQAMRRADIRHIAGHHCEDHSHF